MSTPPDFYRETKAARATRARTVRGAPTALGLFSGAGGFELGFRRAGFNILASSDIDPMAEATHKYNWPDTPFLCEDIRNLTVDRLSEVLGGRRPDVIVGGPPCQGFSTLGSRLSSDPRNELVEAFIRIVEGLRPQAVVIENVRAIATEYKGRHRDYVIARLQEAGYKVSFDILDAADYGVPQHRRRAFFVAFSDPRIEYEFPSCTHGPTAESPYTTVGWALGDLVDKTEDDVPNHQALNHTERVVARYKLIPEGGKLPPPEEMPKEIRRKNFGSTYKRLHRDRPSLTVVPGNNALPVHPTLDRSLTPREAARLQTFPDDFLFKGDRRKQCQLVGNAVPPALAKIVAASVWDRILPFRGASTQITAARPVVVAKSRAKASSSLGKLVPRLTPEAPGFVDLFSGAGGFTLGLARAGLRPLVAADHNKEVAKTHERNYPGVPFVFGDLSLPEVQEEVASLSGSGTFAVVGGPPCQGFSIFGKRRLAKRDLDSDPRNRLVLSFIDTVARISPRWVVMENVSGFETMDDGRFVEAVIKELRNLGYSSIDYRVLNAADYGVPQHRRRFVLIANRSGLLIPWPKPKYFANPTDWQRPFATVGSAISDLASPESYEQVTCHVPMNHRPLQVERYKRIPEGGRLDVDALPPNLRKGYRSDRVRNFSHVFRRLHRDEPSITLVPGHNAFPVHPWLNRSLTVREAARLQTFPDEMTFVGARQEQCIQVGNAFPPLLAELLANNIVKTESNSWTHATVSDLARYSLLDIDDDEMAS